ncbi:MAG TPA: TolC family protein [Gemmatimonadaceae bacterium]|jgi:cobalt-zinc-cadmium efflux system outer membrane protein
MRLIAGLCALAVCGGVVSAQAPTTDSLRLSRRQAIAEALTRNAQLDIAREQTAEARARRVTAIAIPDPSLSAAYDQINSPFTFGGAPSKPVSLGLDIPFPDKFRLNNRIGLADIGANESNYRLQTQTIANQTSATYDSLLVALQHRADLVEAQTLANDFLTRTQARFNAGSAARLDVIQAQVGVAQAANDLIGNERDLAVAQASLNRMLGRVIGAPIAPTDSLTMPAALPDSSSIEQTALTHRPELAVLENQIVGAHATTNLTKEFWLPDLNFAVGRDYAQPGSPLFTTGITLPLPLLYWQHSKGDIAQAQHFERELDATYRDARAQVTQDVRSAYANASTAMRQVTFIRDELVPAAREAYRVSSTSYTLGGSSALEVLTARTALLQAESQLSDALAAANTARTDLDRALGITASIGANDK